MDMLRFPLFISLEGKKAVVVGGGKIGSRRARVLRDFGARVTVIDPKGAEIEGAVSLRREFGPGDLDGAFICVAATDSREINNCVCAEAKRLEVPISVADSPGDCDFFFPAVCQGAGLVVGLVSDGTDHHKTARMAQKIRHILEEEE